jgi:hypothetical protein
MMPHQGCAQEKQALDCKQRPTSWQGGYCFISQALANLNKQAGGWGGVQPRFAGEHMGVLQPMPSTVLKALKEWEAAETARAD